MRLRDKVKQHIDNALCDWDDTVYDDLAECGITVIHNIIRDTKDVHVEMRRGALQCLSVDGINKLCSDYELAEQVSILGTDLQIAHLARIWNLN